MKLILDSPSNRKIALKYATVDSFDPFNMSGPSALGFLKEVSQKD